MCITVLLDYLALEMFPRNREIFLCQYSPETEKYFHSKSYIISLYSWNDLSHLHNLPCISVISILHARSVFLGNHNVHIPLPYLVWKYENYTSFRLGWTLGMSDEFCIISIVAFIRLNLRLSFGISSRSSCSVCIHFRCWLGQSGSIIT